MYNNLKEKVKGFGKKPKKVHRKVVQYEHVLRKTEYM